MSFGFGDAVTILTCFKLARNTCSALKDAPAEFEGLSLEVFSLQISLRSLADDDTSLSILRYASQQKQENLRMLLRDCTKVLDGFNKIIYRCSSLRPNEKSRFFQKVKFASTGKQELRDKLATHTASMSIFLNSLTHGSLGRLEQILSDGPRSASERLAQAPVRSRTGEDGLDGAWIRIGRDLAIGGVTKQDVMHFENEIVAYVNQLIQNWNQRSRTYARQKLSTSQSPTWKGWNYMGKVADEEPEVARRRAEQRPSREELEELEKVDPVDYLVNLFAQIVTIEDDDIEAHPPIPKIPSSSPEVKNTEASPSNEREPTNKGLPRSQRYSQHKDVAERKRKKALEDANEKLSKLEQKMGAAERIQDMDTASDLRYYDIPAAQEWLQDLRNSYLICDSCDSFIVNAHWRCNVCSHDLCESCYGFGERCQRSGHKLVKAFAKEAGG